MICRGCELRSEGHASGWGTWAVSACVHGSVFLLRAHVFHFRAGLCRSQSTAVFPACEPLVW